YKRKTDVNMTDEWLSLSDAAKLLGVHPSTVRLWSDKGVLPTHRTSGGHRRYRRNEMLLWAKTAREIRVEPDSIMHTAMKNVRVQIGDAFEAHAIGYEYASRARRYGLSEVDATRALLFFRNVLIESVMKVFRE